MPLVAAAICPHPPVLVPEIASGAAGELDDLRTACDRALESIFATEPRVLTLVGAGPVHRRYQQPLSASFADFGVALHTSLPAGCPPGEPLPLSLAMGVWLVRRAIDVGVVLGPVVWRALTVSADWSARECARFGTGLGRNGGRHALLVLGDGSACRSEKAPGYLDPRAEAFDSSVSSALADADTAALLALDPVLAADLLAAGRAPWQVLAGAASAEDRPLRGEVLYDAAPYGVQYTVAVWR